MSVTISSTAGSITIRNPKYPIKLTPVTDVSIQYSMHKTLYTYVKTPIYRAIGISFEALTLAEIQSILSIMEDTPITLIMDSGTYVGRITNNNVSAIEESRSGYTLSIDFEGTES